MPDDWCPWVECWVGRLSIEWWVDSSSIKNVANDKSSSIESVANDKSSRSVNGIFVWNNFCWNIFMLTIPKLLHILTSIWVPCTQLRRIGSSWRQLSKLWYLSRYRCLILKTSNHLHPISDFSPTWVCPITLFFKHAYTITELCMHLFWSKCLSLQKYNNLSYRHQKKTSTSVWISTQLTRFCSIFFFPFLQFLCEKREKSIIWLAFGVRSTQTLAKIYNSDSLLRFRMEKSKSKFKEGGRK